MEFSAVKSKISFDPQNNHYNHKCKLQELRLPVVTNVFYSWVFLIGNGSLSELNKPTKQINIFYYL